eukprot:1191508-Prorocentrum_minimum.AAC.1
MTSLELVGHALALAPLRHERVLDRVDGPLVPPLRLLAVLVVLPLVALGFNVLLPRLHLLTRLRHRGQEVEAGLGVVAVAVRAVSLHRVDVHGGVLVSVCTTLGHFGGLLRVLDVKLVLPLHVLLVLLQLLREDAGRGKQALAKPLYHRKIRFPSEICVDTDVRPLLSRSTTEKSGSLPKCYPRAPKKRRRREGASAPGTL